MTNLTFKRSMFVISIVLNTCLYCDPRGFPAHCAAQQDHNKCRMHSELSMGLESDELVTEQLLPIGQASVMSGAGHQRGFHQHSPTKICF